MTIQPECIKPGGAAKGGKIRHEAYKKVRFYFTDFIICAKRVLGLRVKFILGAADAAVGYILESAL